MTIFDGQGVWIYNMLSCSGGYPPESQKGLEHIVNAVKLLDLAWVAPKVSNGYLPYNRVVGRGMTTNNGPDGVLPAIYDAMTALHKPRIGWGYVYGNVPQQEADIAISQIRKYKLQGWLVDAESEYDGKAEPARLYMRTLRNACPDVAIAFAGWKQPSYHPKYPLVAFLEYMDASRGDVWMPQVYWIDQTSPARPAEELAASMKELLKAEALPYLPIGAAFGQTIKNKLGIPIRYWQSTAEQMANFSAAAKTAGCPGISWWSWDLMAEKDSPDPTSGKGSLNWWKTIGQEAPRWALGEQPVPEPQPQTWEQAVDAFLRRMGFDGPEPKG